MSKIPKLEVIAGTETRPEPDPPPRPLGEHGLALWRSILDEFILDDTASREMLCSTCAALESAERIDSEVSRDGYTIRTKTTIRARAALRLELADRFFVFRTLFKFGLVCEHIKSVGRPGSAIGL